MWLQAPNCGIRRHLQVLLPVASDAEVSDEVFKRTSAEVMRDFRRMQLRREQEQTLMTRAMREKLANKTKKVHRFARIRVRFREGLVLQGVCKLRAFYQACTHCPSLSSQHVVWQSCACQLLQSSAVQHLSV